MAATTVACTFFGLIQIHRIARATGPEIIPALNILLALARTYLLLRMGPVLTSATRGAAVAGMVPRSAGWPL
jgi:hypothetical protein